MQQSIILLFWYYNHTHWTVNCGYKARRGGILTVCSYPPQQGVFISQQVEQPHSLAAKAL